MTSRGILTAAGISGMLMVLLGAFGAHQLEKVLDADAMATWQTAVLYHMVHTLALFVLGVMTGVLRNLPKVFRYAAMTFLLGILLFSGSLYVLAATGAGWLGMVTPVGGVLFIIGWVQITLGALRRKG